MEKLKLTIKANGKILKTKTSKDANKQIDNIEIIFNTCDIWSDLELWLNNQNDEFLDHLAITISKRQKMQAHK